MVDTPKTLAEPAREWIASQVATGAWPNAEAYLADLVERDRQDAEKLAFVRSAVAEGRASGTSERTLDDIVAEGRARHKRG